MPSEERFYGYRDSTFFEGGTNDLVGYKLVYLCQDRIFRVGVVAIVIINRQAEDSVSPGCLLKDAIAARLPSSQRRNHPTNLPNTFSLHHFAQRERVPPRPFQHSSKMKFFGQARCGGSDWPAAALSNTAFFLLTSVCAGRTLPVNIRDCKSPHSPSASHSLPTFNRC